MTRTYCDICSCEGATEKYNATYYSVYGGTCSQQLDVCKECLKNLWHLRLKIEDAFIKSKGDCTQTIEFLKAE